MTSQANGFRVATYNIHKGVQGLGPARRLEIHNLGHAIEQLDADIVCLQEVRKMNRQAAARFERWPELPQADFLAPEGYTAVYETNAVTRHGEHGNALLTRWPVLRTTHLDISDHRFEQRGLLHAAIEVEGRTVHAIVVHLGLIKGSRVRQVAQLREFIDREIPADESLVVAGDFNDWGARMRDERHGPARYQRPARPAHADLSVAAAGGAAGLHLRAAGRASGHIRTPWADLGPHVRPSAAGRRLSAAKVIRMPAC
jgi:endonuclease/exonuclease/phosphatase family metal-dependent hydrolase